MSTLLDRLLEVAKDFEAERLNEQVVRQKERRVLENEIKSLEQTCQYRSDEISFLEQQLSDVRAELDEARSSIRDLEDKLDGINGASSSSGDSEQLRKEVACLRMEVLRLRAGVPEKENAPRSSVNTDSRLSVPCISDAMTRGWTAASLGGDRGLVPAGRAREA